jgi:uncharacterized protein
MANTIPTKTTQKTTDELLAMIADGGTDRVFEYVAQGGAVEAIANGESLVSLCAYHGDVAAIKHLLAHGAKLETIGARPLFNAAFFGHHRLCQFLIEQGYDPNVTEPDTGETALHAATSKLERESHDETLRVLLAAGANPNAATTPGVITSCLMRDCLTKGETPLHRAAAFGNNVSIKLLLDAGAVIDGKDANGETALGWASWHRRPGAILGQLVYGHYVGTIRASHIEHDRAYARGLI